MAMSDIKDKFVVLTGNRQVGYGTENDGIIGVALSCDLKEPTDTYSLYAQRIKDAATYDLDATTKAKLGLDDDLDYVVAVERHITVEDVPMPSTASKKPVFGNAVVADGSGGIVKAADGATTHFTALCESVDATAGTATITLM